MQGKEAGLNLERAALSDLSNFPPLGTPMAPSPATGCATSAPTTVQAPALSGHPSDPGATLRPVEFNLRYLIIIYASSA